MFMLDGRIYGMHDPQALVAMLEHAADTADHDAARLPSSTKSIRRDIETAAKRCRVAASLVRKRRRSPASVDSRTMTRHFDRAHRALDVARAGWTKVQPAVVEGVITVRALV